MTKQRTQVEPSMVISNEFAAVRLTIAESHLGQRLRITDCTTGEERCLDALELEALIWATYEDYDRLMDPSHSRWRTEDQAMENPGNGGTPGGEK
jgi:hypothetical protein